MRVILTAGERESLAWAVALPPHSADEAWALYKRVLPNCPETDPYVLRDVFRALLAHAEVAE